MLFDNYGAKTENVTSVIGAAREAISSMRDMRVIRAEHSENGWRLKYITLDDSYPIAAIERSLTRAVGETVNMVNLHYDFDTAARLIYA